MKTLQLVWYRVFRDKVHPFFKPLFYFMASLTGLSTSLLALKVTEQIPQSFYPLIESTAGWLAIIGVVGMFLTSLPTKDPGLQQNELPLKRRKAKK